MKPLAWILLAVLVLALLWMGLHRGGPTPKPTPRPSVRFTGDVHFAEDAPAGMEEAAPSAPDPAFSTPASDGLQGDQIAWSEYVDGRYRVHLRGGRVVELSPEELSRMPASVRTLVKYRGGPKR